MKNSAKSKLPPVGELYEEQLQVGSYRKLARKYGVSGETIRLMFIEAGLTPVTDPRYTRGNRVVDRVKVIELAKSNHTYNQIAAQVGCGVATVCRILTDAGLARRKNG